jgi:hypothetical protein
MPPPPLPPHSPSRRETRITQLCCARPPQGMQGVQVLLKSPRVARWPHLGYLLGSIPPLHRQLLWEARALSAPKRKHAVSRAARRGRLFLLVTGNRAPVISFTTKKIPGNAAGFAFMLPQNSPSRCVCGVCGPGFPGDGVSPSMEQRCGGWHLGPRLSFQSVHWCV